MDKFPLFGVRQHDLVGREPTAVAGLEFQRGNRLPIAHVEQARNLAHFERAPRAEEARSRRRRNRRRMHRWIASLLAAALAAATPLAAAADGAPPGGSQNATGYDGFTAGAQAQRGLFTIWRKDEHVYIDLAPGQLDKDYLETIVPGNGFGGNFIVWGNTDHLPAMLVRFHRVTGGNVAIVWPNTSFVAPGSASGTAAVQKNFPQSVVGVAKIVAENAGHVVFDASPLFSDTLDLGHIINESLGTTPATAYRLDSGRTYFGESKAFPQNVVIHVEQLWATEEPHVAPDTAPDSRSVQMDVAYNFVELPHDDGYTPRYADDRVGIYDDVYLSFANDLARDRHLRYLVRWNLRPSDPSKLSPATHPMVYTMSASVPPEFRKAIRDAVLRWNLAFEKIGISDAIQVVDQPNDPNFDADDVRYNVLRWVTEQQPSFGADSQTLFDPRTGEEFRTGILISADSARGPVEEWRTVIDPARYGRDTDPVPPQLVYDSFQAEIMHETGHNLGMQHNFIGSMAYTAKQIQDPAFTPHTGSPRPSWSTRPPTCGRAPTARATTTRRSWALRLLRDEVCLRHDSRCARRPRRSCRRCGLGASLVRTPVPLRLRRRRFVGQRPCRRSARRARRSDRRSALLVPSADGDVPRADRRRDDALREARRGLSNARRPRFRACSTAICATRRRRRTTSAANISRARTAPIRARNRRSFPSRSRVQKRAFDMLDRYLFSDDQLPVLTGRAEPLAYSEWAGYGYVGWEGYGNLPVWAYNPPQRHDYPVIENIGRSQRAAIAYIFQPAGAAAHRR